MDTSTALTTAGAIGLTVAGGVSALFLTVNQAVVAESASDVNPVIVTEYVDQFGNPVSVAALEAPTQAVVQVSNPAVAAAAVATPEATTLEYQLAEPYEAAYDEAEDDEAEYSGGYEEEEHDEEGEDDD